MSPYLDHRTIGTTLHCIGRISTAEENSLGVMDYKWERFDADHYVHAYLYFRVGISRFANGDGQVFFGTKSFGQDAPTIQNATVSFDPTKKFILEQQEPEDWRN